MYIDRMKCSNCGKGEIVRIDTLKPQGKKEIPAFDFLNGYRIKAGEFFE